MTAYRTGAAAATLLDGRVLVTGGSSNGESLASAEIYDGKSFTAVASMNEARAQHTAATLKDGRVVVIGGYATGKTPITSIEIYDPKANTWSEVPGGLIQARAEHTATVMRDGRLLIAGGMGSSGILNTLEIYDPAANTCALAAPVMSSPRIGHAAALLPNGDVMLAGGFDGTNVLASIDAYDPAANAMSPPRQMAYARRDFTATSLVDGRILLAGGNDGTNDVTTLEIADLLADKISLAGNLTTARSHAMAIALPDNGSVLIVGGTAGGSPVASAELYSPVSSTTSPAGSMSVARSGGIAAMLAISGRESVLVAGGESSGNSSTGDLYSFPTLRTDRPDYAPYTTVTVTGKGWAPGESVTLVFHENPTGDPDVTYTATADASGSFQNTSFKPDLHDESISFLLTAKGAQTGSTAQATFTDSSYQTSIGAPQPTSGTVGSTITVSAYLSYGYQQYQEQPYYYSCDPYSCNCGWTSCSTCWNTCEGYNYVYVGTYWYPLTGVPVQFAFSNGASVTGYTDSSGSAYAQIVVPPGVWSLSANYGGNGTYSASQSTSSFYAQQANTRIALSPVATPAYGQSALTLSATLTLTSGAPATGQSIQFQIDGIYVYYGTTDASGVATVTAGISALSGGTHSVTANFQGSSSCCYPSSSTENFMIPLTKTISFPALTSPVTAGSSQTLAATSSNGDPVTYTVTSGAATITGNAVTFTTAGTVTIEADSAATPTYYAAAPVSQTIPVNAAPTSYTAPTEPVTTTSAVQTATVNFTSGATLGSISVVTQGATGKDFNVAPGGTCAVGTAYTSAEVCTVNYTFTPLSPGTREGAVVLKDTSGNVLGTSYLGGVGTGPLGLFTTATQTLSISGLSEVRGISLDGYGNLYGFDTAPGVVAKFAAGSNSETVLATLPASSAGGATALDGAGNLFVMDTAAATLYEFVGASGPAITVASGIPSSDDNLEVDGAGNLYYSGYHSGPIGAIYKVAAGNHQITTLVPGNLGHRFVAMAVDPAGNIFAPDFSNNILYELPAGSNTLVTLVSGGYLSNPHGVAVDPAGNVYVTNISGSNVIRYATGTYAATLLPAAGQRGVALDGAGNLYTITTDQTIAEFTRTQANPFTFANTMVGTSGDSQQGVVFENDGNADLIVTGYSAAAPFALNGSQNTCGVGTLASGASCVVGASFSPLNVGPYSGTATITDNTLGVAGTAQTIALSGTAIPGTQTITFTAPPTPVTYGIAPFTLSATGGASGNPVMFSVQSGPGTIAGNLLTITGAGTVVLAANQAGDTQYLAAPQVTQTVYVIPAPKTIGFPQPATPVLVNSTAVLGATSSNGDPVIYSIVTGSASISGSTVTYSNAGTVTIEADSPATANYAAAPPVTVSVTVNPEPSSYIAPTTAVASLSAIQTAYVNFTASGTLGSISALTQGAANLDFNVVAGGTCVVGAAYTSGQACSVNYTFGPLAPGVRLGAIQLESNASVVLGTSYVGGVGTAPQGVFTQSVQSTYQNTTGILNALTVDASGNLYYSTFNTGNNGVYKIAAGTGTTTQLVGGLSLGDGIAVDGAGNIFYTDYNTGRVSELVGGTGTPVLIDTEPNPEGLALDLSGNLYVAVAGNHNVVKLLEGSFTHSTTYGTGLLHPQSVAVDAGGNVYISDRDGGSIVMAAPDGTSQAVIGSVNTPAGIALDAAGDLYVAPVGTVNGPIVKFAAGTFTQTLLGRFARPAFLTLDSSGNILVVDRDNNAIEKLTRASATPLTFASTPVGSSAAQQVAGIENDGNAPLAIASITATANFTIGSNTCGNALSAGAACVIGAVFTPTTATALTGTVVVNDNNLNVAGALQNIALSGQGTPGPQTITFKAPPSPVTYGVAPITLSATGGASGNPVTFSVQSGPGSITGTSLSITGAGTVVIAANQSGDANYLAAPQVTQSVVVNPATLTAAIVGNPTKTYNGSNAAALTPTNFQLTGLVGSDNFTVTQTAGTYASANAGAQAVTATLSSANFSAVSGSLSSYVLPTTASGSGTIGTAPASVTPNAADKIYGTADPALTGTLTGFVAADGVTATYARAAGETVLGGPYAISATLSAAGLLSNYSITYNTAKFTITPAPASVTSNAASKTYGQSDPALTGTLSGFLPADNVAAAYTRAVGETVIGGPYTISATLSPAAVLSNYAITYNTAAFTITPATASVTPTAATKIYGTADPALTGVLTGFLAGDNVTAAYTRAPGETVLGGPYAIRATLAPTAVLSNYNITYNTAAFTITPAPASVNPNGATKVYGTPDPALSGILVGFLPADSVVASYTRAAGETVLGGPYVISATLAPAAVLSNYTVTYNTGLFTITPAPASVSFGNVVQTYTSGPLAPTVTTVPAGLSYSMGGAPDIAAGGYTVTATVTNPNYVGSGSTPFTIQQAPATIALSNLSQVYSGNPESATATVTPSYCGPASVTYAGGAAAPSNIGTYPVVAIEANPNCTAPNATGTLIINAFAASSCVYALNPTARNAFSVSDGATVDAQCSIQINSASRDAFDVDGHKSTVDATAISVVGGASIDRSSTVSNTPATGQASVADPLAAVVAPSVGACVNAGDHDWDGDEQHGAAGQSITINPGTYCGGIHIHGNSTVTFNPGTYILLGGGLNIDGGAQVTGTGVTFYNTGDREHHYQPIHIDGGSKTTLSAPVSGSLAGVLFFQDRNIAQHADADDHDGGNHEDHAQANTITGNTESSFTGALYFPTTPLVYAGGSEQDPGAYTLIVADTISVAAQSNVSLTVLGTPMSDTDSDVCSPGPGKDCDHDKDGDHN